MVFQISSREKMALLIAYSITIRNQEDVNLFSFRKIATKVSVSQIVELCSYTVMYESRYRLRSGPCLILVIKIICPTDYGKTASKWTNNLQ